VRGRGGAAGAKEKERAEGKKGRVRQLGGRLGYESIEDVSEAAGISEEDDSGEGGAAPAASPAQQEAAKQ